MDRWMESWWKKEDDAEKQNLYGYNEKGMEACFALLCSWPSLSISRYLTQLFSRLPSIMMVNKHGYEEDPEIK